MLLGALGGDDEGKLTSVTSTGVPTDNHTWGYTTIDQLQSDTAQANNYTYDSADNLTRHGNGTVQKFDAGNQLCWTAPSGSGACGSPPGSSTTYTYDTRGNRTQAVAPGGTTTDAYNQANQLTSVNNGTTTSYTYNGDGLRTGRTGAVNSTFRWDTSGELPLLLVDGSTAYIYGPRSQPITQVNSTTALTFHRDQLGSTRALTDSGGAVVATYSYDPYGNTTGSTGTISNPFRFAGDYTDAETGFLYLRARHYDPVTAQFLQRDPAVSSTAEAYGYAGGSPINRTDPTELAWWDPRDNVPPALRGAARDALEAANKHRETIASAAAVASCIGSVGLTCIALTTLAVGVRSYGRFQEHGVNQETVRVAMFDGMISFGTLGLVKIPSQLAAPIARGVLAPFLIKSGHAGVLGGMGYWSRRTLDGRLESADC